MKIVTSESFNGKELEHLGIVQGSIVQINNSGKNLQATFKAIVGGELENFTELLQESRKIASDRMVKEAENLGADAIIMARFATAQIMDMAAEIIVYGTAVRFK